MRNIVKNVWVDAESAKSRAWRACVLTCFACLRASVLTCLACLRAYVFSVLMCLACLHAWRAFVFASLTYVLAMMGAWCQYKKGNSWQKVTKIMKMFLKIYLMPSFPKWSDIKFWVSLKTVKLTRLNSEMDKKCYEKWNICANVKNCKVLEVLTCFRPFRSYLSNEYNGCN